MSRLAADPGSADPALAVPAAASVTPAAAEPIDVPAMDVPAKAAGSTPNSARTPRAHPSLRDLPRSLKIGPSSFVTTGLPYRRWHDFYHHFLTMRWPAFFGAFAMIYLVVNAVFACLYQLGPHAIADQSPPGFLGAFFFSVETLATVGYGDMHPQTIYAHTVASVEIFSGLSGLAVFTGLVFTRFSRPRAKILFARHPVVRPIDGVQTLMIRAANARLNVISEANAKLRLMRIEISAEGYENRKLHDLKLVREQHPIFVLGWNLTHQIDVSSPLYGETAETLAAKEATLILTIDGVDETTSQVMRGRHIYGADTIRWQHRYPDLIQIDEQGVRRVDYNKFHDVEPL